MLLTNELEVHHSEPTTIPIYTAVVFCATLPCTISVENFTLGRKPCSVKMFHSYHIRWALFVSKMHHRRCFSIDSLHSMLWGSSYYPIEMFGCELKDRNSHRRFKSFVSASNLNFACWINWTKETELFKFTNRIWHFNPTLTSKFYSTSIP